MNALLDSVAISKQRAKNKKAGGTKLRTAELPLSFLRELNDDDLPELTNPSNTSKPADPYSLKRIRARHHLLAMLLAKGAKTVEASYATGYDPQTINIMRRSPAFVELLSYYQEQQQEAFAGFAEQAAAVGMEALSIMQERMQDEPDSIKFNELAGLAEMLFDRTILPSKAAKLQPAAPQAPVTVIQFIDSPHQAEPQPKAAIDVTPRREQIEVSR